MKLGHSKLGHPRHVYESSEHLHASSLPVRLSQPPIAIARSLTHGLYGAVWTVKVDRETFDWLQSSAVNSGTMSADESEEVSSTLS